MISLWYHFMTFHMWYHFDSTTQIHLNFTCDITVISLSDISHVISLWYHNTDTLENHMWYHLVTFHMWYHFDITNTDTVEYHMWYHCDITWAFSEGCLRSAVGSPRKAAMHVPPSHSHSTEEPRLQAHLERSLAQQREGEVAASEARIAAGRVHTQD